MKRILWAIDPYQSDVASLIKEARFLIGWFPHLHPAAIEPVFVLTPGMWLLPNQFFRQNEKLLLEESAARLAPLHAGIRSAIFRKTTLLVNPSDHVENVVRTLLNHACEQGSELIVLRTHGRQGLERMVLGSVAETLLLRSPIPGLFLKTDGTSHRHSVQLKILVPTDLELDIETLSPILELAADLHAELQLIHAVPQTDSPIQQILGLSQVPDFEDMRSRENKARILKEAATFRGIGAQSFILRTRLSLSQLIVEQATQLRSNLIAMVAKSGETQAIFAGSTTRQVVRTAPCPVWTLHQHPVSHR